MEETLDLHKLANAGFHLEYIPVVEKQQNRFPERRYCAYHKRNGVRVRISIYNGEDFCNTCIEEMMRKVAEDSLTEDDLKLTLRELALKRLRELCGMEDGEKSTEKSTVK